MAYAIAFLAGVLLVLRAKALQVADRKFAEHDGQPRIHTEGYDAAAR